MKIIRTDVVYTQRRDINYIVKHKKDYPISIKLCDELKGNKKSLEDFVIIKDREARTYISDANYIVNYNDVKDCNEKILIKMLNHISNKAEGYSKTSEEYNDSAYRYQDINNFLLYKRGKNKDMSIPNAFSDSSNSVFTKIKKLIKGE